MKKYLYALALGALGIAALYFLMWSMRLGDYAESPQHFLLTTSLNRVAAGGKAGLLFQGRDEEGAAPRRVERRTRRRRFRRAVATPP